jgi:hypothetical protein
MKLVHAAASFAWTGTCRFSRMLIGFLIEFIWV